MSSYNDRRLTFLIEKLASSTNNKQYILNAHAADHIKGHEV